MHGWLLKHFLRLYPVKFAARFGIVHPTQATPFRLGRLTIPLMMSSLTCK